MRRLDPGAEGDGGTARPRPKYRGGPRIGRLPGSGGTTTVRRPVVKRYAGRVPVSGAAVKREGR